MAIAFVAVDTKVGGGSGPSLAIPGGSVGDMLIAGRAAGSSGTTLNDQSGWTLADQLEGGTGSSIDAHVTKARADYREADGFESDPTAFSGTSLGYVIGLMARYSKAGGSTWDVAATTGNDNTHGSNRATSGANSITWLTGDMCVVVVATDTDTALTITSPAVTATNVTFGTCNRRSPSTAGTTSGQDGNIEIFDVAVTATNGSPNTSPALQFTTATSQCGPVVFVRLREISAAEPPAPPILRPYRAAVERSVRW